MKMLKELGEDLLIKQLCEGLRSSDHLLVGPGDDCAVIDTGKILTLLKTDAVVEGVHFLPDTSARKIGWKAVARVLSDFAAMGGQPTELLVTLALTEKTTVRWVRELYRGMEKCLLAHGGIIVGGETTSLPCGAPSVISIAGRGTVPRKQLVTRSGGKPTDVLFVTGRLGGSINGKHLTFTPRLAEAEWLTQNFPIHAMMDLSDGLAKDLPRLAAMSQCGFSIEEASIPRTPACSPAQAIGDGEDFELLFATSLRTARRLLEEWPKKFPKLTLSQIGSLNDSQSQELPGGWEHFKSSR